MKFMLPVLIAIIFSAVTLFPQKTGSPDTTVPAVINNSENPRITYANTPNETETITWSALIQGDYRGVYNTGVYVYALAANNGNIYLGGTFANACNVSGTSKIAKWDGSQFHNLGSGFNATVNALAIYDGKLIAGGSFTYVNDDELHKNLSRWNNTAWESIGIINNQVNAITISGSNLFIGGTFTAAGGVSGTNYVARYDGYNWHALGSESAGYGVNGTVNAIAVANNKVYIGGFFTFAGNTSVNNIAEYDLISQTWSNLSGGVEGTVYAIEVFGSDVYVGGQFAYPATNIAKWNNGWSSVGSNIGEVVRVIKITENAKYAGTLSTLMVLNGTLWEPIEGAPNGSVYALAVNTSAGEMYVGGAFTTVNSGSLTVNRIAKFTSNDDPLPVELTSFSAKRVSDGVELRWATATEVNNYGFEIERTIAVETMHALSLQDRNWEKIDFVPGYGNSNSPKQYIFRDNTSRADQSYIYRLKQIDSDGSFSYSGELHVGSGAPASFDLKQNFPNPFNPATMISYTLPASGMVQLKIYNATGEEITTLISELQDAGSYQINFNGSGLASGTYLYRITVTSAAGVYTQSRKMIILK
ncbi:MAG: T9SS type A sorting domain-containing protein [Ignavibacteriaceae bacterium]|nr:T9SS type A sorting domain-containing protein [Ignavibacteriaceae bacterium]